MRTLNQFEHGICMDQVPDKELRVILEALLDRLGLVILREEGFYSPPRYELTEQSN